VAVKNIARRLGGDISEVSPILDSRLPDGSRVAVVIPPCSLNGIKLTIRKFNTRRFEMQDLIAVGTLDQPLANRLEDYVLSRKNILISGSTSCGKSTLLNLLGKLIPEDERILLIEDTAEIALGHPNLVRFEARHAQNGVPGIAIRDLLRASLRHRPDRILLGEIRGGEAFDLLQLLNTRHSGTLSTIHANSAKQARARFTSCVLESGVELPHRAIKSSIADSLHIVIQMERRPGRPYISEVQHRLPPRFCWRLQCAQTRCNNPIRAQSGQFGEIGTEMQPVNPLQSEKKLVDVTGFEPATPCLQSRCSPS
jgi:pilus assembly protein CpaF